jgi:hypothetical protein
MIISQVGQSSFVEILVSCVGGIGKLASKNKWER